MPQNWLAKLRDRLDNIRSCALITCLDLTDLGFIILRLTVFCGGLAWLLVSDLPPEMAGNMVWLLLFFAVYSILLFFLLYFFVHRKKILYLISLFLDLSFVSMLVHISGGYLSPFTNGFYLMTALYSFYYGVAIGLGVAALSAGLYFISEGVDFNILHWTDFSVRAAFLFLLAVPIGMFSQKLQKDKEIIESYNRQVRATEETLRQTTDDLRRSLVEMQGTQDALLRQEKLASIGTLASGVAHEILNPLNIIGTIVQTLRMEEELPAEVHEQLDEVVVQIGRATKITNSLRNFSRQGQVLEIREMDLHALLDNTLELVEHDLKLDNIEVQKNYGQEVPVIAADPDQLAQVLINLINNARDAMHDSKVRRLSFTTSRMGEMVGLAVADSGSGISADHLPKLFDPFFTTKEPGSGTGLGLSIVHSIVESMGGFIEVDSIPGRGTKFLIQLPRSTTTA